MGSRTCLFISLCVAVAVAAYFHHKLTFVPPLPELDLDAWWGPGSPKKMDTAIRPFKINFTEEMISDLRYRLSRSRLVEPLEDAKFIYGTNTNYLKTVLNYWNKEYNFKEREVYFNKYPHYKTYVQGLDIHFIHVKPRVAANIKVYPLLALHGWPGSIKEYYEAIPLLTTPQKGRDFVFEVILPSLPGYGFSQASSKKTMGAPEHAVVMRNLMRRLGIKQYYVQGGDWGSIIGSLIATYFPDDVLGYHCTMVNLNWDLSGFKLLLGSIYPPMMVDKAYEDRIYPLSDTFRFLLEETGYMHIQSTKPDTVGVGLNDSPAGLAAYILEKFSVGTNPNWRALPDGGLTDKYKMVDLIDNLMVYWVSESITSSVRLYAESFRRDVSLKTYMQPITVPSAIANFRYEVMYFPEWVVRDRFVNLVQFTHYDHGGHFSALEHPDELSEDIWTAVEKMRKSKPKS